MNENIDIIDKGTRTEIYRAEVGIVAGEPWDIGPVGAGELSRELDFDLFRHVMESVPGDE